MYATRPRGMTKEEQKEFVLSMTDWITKAILKTIVNGRIPPHWGGTELRLYVTEKFIQGCDAQRYADSATMLEYEHDVITREL